MSDDLTFDSVTYGEGRIPLTLRPCLYVNGAGCHAKKFSKSQHAQSFGSPVGARRPLVYALHSILNGIVSSGQSPATLRLGVGRVRDFYKYCDSYGLNPTMENACVLYCGWVKSIYKKINDDDIKESGCYGAASSMATLLGVATDLGRDYFVLRADLRAPMKSNNFPKIDKQSLRDAKRFIADLMDIRDCLGVDAFKSPLPTTLKFSDGATVDLYSGLTQHEKLQPHKLANTSLKARYAVYNIRAELELFIFISQTSMNLSDAANLEDQDLKYYDVGDCFEARAYKGRKKGEVIFTAYREYKPYFLEFLDFKKELCVGSFSTKVFGKLPQPGRAVSDNPNPRALIKLMKDLGRPMVVATVLRRTRQNWLARRAGNPSVAAEIGQHDTSTFLRAYSRPHHQTASTEWTNYFRNHAQAKRAAFEGHCNGTPVPIEGLPKAIDKPNCANQNLCIFCLNYKGIKTYSYIWSLISYQVLREREKLLVLKGNGDVSGLDSTLDRIEKIVSAFEAAGKKCASWLAKAVQQVRAGNYHPRWNGFIQLIEVSSL